MKKAGIVLISATALCIVLVIGVFIGRNSIGSEYYLPDTGTELVINTEPVEAKADINKVKMVTLTELDGIGQVTAQNIIDYREEHGPFTSMDQLLEVEGVGETRLRQLKKYFTVGG